MAEASPVIVNGEEDPVTVSPVGLEVAVNEDATDEFSGKLK